ncbi:MAG: GNAT family N-acetyltransferase [Egibacteraceae bacterium]
MTTTPARARAARLARADVAHVTALLERDFGHRQSRGWAYEHHYLLDALDRGEHGRFLVWPDDDPVAVLYFGPTATLVPAGDPVAATAFAGAANPTGWRILIGDLEISQAVLDLATRSLFRRRVSSREQRLMIATAGSVPDGDTPDGFRLADTSDLDRLTDFACQLHVEDQMGTPILRSGRGGVRSRVAESVAQAATWVVDRGGAPIAKIDLSLRSWRRGVQLAGVFVEPKWRDRGIGGSAVRALTRELLDAGFPLVSLHVRADNFPAIAAYRRAGFIDQRPWLLALR